MKCDNCYKWFDHRGNFNSHVKRCGISYFCTNCSKQFPTKSKLIRHNESCRDFQCTKCAQNFYRAIDFKNHVRKCGLYCLKCLKTFDSNTKLINHLDKCGVVHNCTKCLKTFLTKSKLEKHLEKCRVDYNCTKCSKTFEIKSKLEKHLKKCSVDYKCTKCSKAFRNKYNLERHEKKCLSVQCDPTTNNYKCMNCNRIYTKAFDYNLHAFSCKSLFHCHHCTKSFSSFKNMQSHTEICSGLYLPKKIKSKQHRLHCVPLKKGLVYFESLNGNAADVYIKNIDYFVDPMLFLEIIRSTIKTIIDEYLVKWNNMKISCLFECDYVKMEEDNTEKYTDGNFKTKIEMLDQGSNLDDFIDVAYAKIMKEIESFEGEGSGWSLHRINGLLLRMSRFIPLKGGCPINLPQKIQNSKAIINVKINNEYCFKNAILSSLITDSYLYNRQSTYDNLNHSFSFEGISFPTPLKDIEKFEKINNVSVNIYCLDSDNDIYPRQMSKNKHAHQHFDLLYIKNNVVDGHFCLIKNFSRLLASQYNKRKRSYLFCKRCFKSFNTDYISVNNKSAEDRLKEHDIICSTHKACRVEMPSYNDRFVKFKNHQKQMRVPVVCYADFEALLKSHDDNDKMSKNKEEEGWTRKVNVHEPCTVGVKVVSTIPSFQKKTYIYTEKNVVFEFLTYLCQTLRLVTELYKTIVPMKEMTDDEVKDFNETTHCGICHQEIKANDIKVRDHCHLTGNFRFAAHNECNINYKLPNFLPVFMHNLSGYDGHFLLLNLNKIIGGEVSILPNTSEKYITFSVRVPWSSICLRFVDTYRFFGTSLETQIKNTSTFPLMEKEFPDNRRDLLLRKGVYPYSYMDSWSKLDETTLPDIQEFTNDLTEEKLDKNDYTHAQSVWDAFKIKTMREYCELYVKTDVILLADVFERFRDICHNIYGLDPAWYLTAPSLSYDAMLKYTAKELEVLTDYDMYLMIEKGVRGGVTSSIYRYAKANNPLVPDYDETKPTNYIVYLDVLNLYGFCQSQTLPSGDFAWDSCNIDVTQIADDAPKGYILEVDIEVPKDYAFHDKFNYLPILAENQAPPGGKHKKLLSTLENKSRYVIHYRALKQALTMGYKLTKIHRCISFSQSRWLEGYISLNTEMRKKATNKFEKDFYKLMVNSVYGRFLMNTRKRMSMELVTNEYKFLKRVKKANFKDRIIYNENIIGIEYHKEKVILNSPIYLGFSVLELSKIHMYDFYYNTMYPKYKERMKCLYIDTDSFHFLIETDNIYQDIWEMKEMFDCSNLDPPYFWEDNAGVLGKFKIETGSKPITFFVSLRPKLYSFKVLGDKKDVTKCKGVKTSAVDKHLTFESYYSILMNPKVKSFLQFKNIMSRKHVLYTAEYKKKALTANDDKRYVLPDNIDTLAYGHYLLDDIEEL